MKNPNPASKTSNIIKQKQHEHIVIVTGSKLPFINLKEEPSFMETGIVFVSFVDSFFSISIFQN